MIKNIVLLFFIFEVILTSPSFLQVQHEKQVCQNKFNSKMYIVDTITINSPLVIKAVDSTRKFLFFLIDEKDLNTIDSLILNQGIGQYILNSENLFSPTYKFDCILHNYIHMLKNDQDSIFIKIKKSIQNSKREVWGEFDNNESLTNEHYSIYTLNVNTFLVVLVRNDFFNYCQSKDEIIPNKTENLYRKIFIPITW